MGQMSLTVSSAQALWQDVSSSSKSYLVGCLHLQQGTVYSGKTYHGSLFSSHPSPGHGHAGRGESSLGTSATAWKPETFIDNGPEVQGILRHAIIKADGNQVRQQGRCPR